MRVAWFAYGDLAQPTGGYIYDRLVVEGLRAAGDEVEVIDPLHRQACEDAEVVVGDALCVRELGPVFEGAPRRAARVLLVHHFTSWELERTDVEVTRPLEARAVLACDLLVATSRATGERLRLEHPGSPVAVVVPGADRLPRAKGGPRHGRVELLFVGSLVPRKRVGLLLDALEGLEPPRPGLTLLGDPARDPACARALADRVEASPALRSCVTFAGVASDAVLAGHLATADALVLPSSLEGYGMVLTEALHAGLPVVAARAAATAAGVVESDAVLSFGAEDELTAILRRFAGDAHVRASMRAHAGRCSLPRWNDAIAAFCGLLVQAQRRP